MVLVLAFKGLAAQKLTYHVYLFGKKIGEAVVERKVLPGGEVYYSLNSNTEAHVMLVTRKSLQNYAVHYKNGQLYKVNAVNCVNDETVCTRIERNNNQYTVCKNTDTICLKGPITCSTLGIYFQEPSTTQVYFSERQAEFFRITKNKEGMYEYTLSDGIKSQFRYANGMPDYILMKKSFVSVEMKLVKVES